MGATATARNILPLRLGQPVARLPRCRRKALALTSMPKLTVFGLCFAAAVALPAMAAAPLSYDDARHLLNRTGFGATDAEIRRFAGMSREDAARKLLATTRTVAFTPPPAWTAQSGPLRYPRGGADASEMERKQFQQEQIREGLQLRGW